MESGNVSRERGEKRKEKRDKRQWSMINWLIGFQKHLQHQIQATTSTHLAMKSKLLFIFYVCFFGIFRSFDCAKEKAKQFPADWKAFDVSRCWWCVWHQNIKIKTSKTLFVATSQKLVRGKDRNFKFDPPDAGQARQWSELIRCAIRWFILRTMTFYIPFLLPSSTLHFFL